MKKRSSKKVVRPQKGGNHKIQSRVRRDPRDKDVITAEEFDLLTSRPHSKATLAYINDDTTASNSTDYDPCQLDDEDCDVTIADLREIDRACINYLKKVGIKSKFNANNIGS